MEDTSEDWIRSKKLRVPESDPAMKLGKVIGQVVATMKDKNLEGFRLVVVQELDENIKPVGKPFVAVDGIHCAGPGDVVYLVFKRDAAIALLDKPPVDATIVGYVDEVAIEKKPGGPMKVWNPRHAMEVKGGFKGSIGND